MSQRGNQSVTQRARLAEMRAERNSHQRAVYQARKESGLCTRCGARGCVDSLLCSTCGKAERARQKAAKRKLREARRRRKQCARCGKPSKRYTCEVCLIRERRLPMSRMVLNGNQSVTQTATTQGHDTRAESDGYARTRYRGRARRGAPSKRDQYAQDLAFGLSSLHMARERMLEVYADTEATAQQREAGMLEWLGQVDLARRFCAEVLEDAGYEKRKAKGRVR